MQTVWSNFLSANENQMKIINNVRKTNLLLNDDLLKLRFSVLIEMLSCDIPYFQKSVFDNVLNKLPLEIVKGWFPHVDDQLLSFVLQFVRNNRELSPLYMKHPPTTYQLRNEILKVSCLSLLKFLLLKYLCLKLPIESLIHLHNRNKTFYMLQQINRINASFDVTSGKLWYAIMVLKTLDYNSTLSIVNQLLSSIPPYALYTPTTTSAAAKCMYVERFLNSSCTAIQRAREAWLTDLVIDNCMSDILPLAIQIELYFCRADCLNFIYDKLIISPFVCAYYLKFLCYHELGQYDNRDRELRQLIDVVYTERCGERQDFSYNIAGHFCLRRER